MTDRQHPIIPPPELVQHWCNVAKECKPDYEFDIATQAARWGADQELEACCHLLRQQGFDVVDDLRAARRPKPPSLKEQALERLSNLESDEPGYDLGIIRRALEQLND